MKFIVMMLFFNKKMINDSYFIKLFLNKYFFNISLCNFYLRKIKNYVRKYENL